jgi:hypothetical protein
VPLVPEPEDPVKKKKIAQFFLDNPSKIDESKLGFFEAMFKSMAHLLKFKLYIEIDHPRAHQ